jgi:hypothetical protein
VIATDDIVSFYQLYESSIKTTTINWRIYELVQQGVLERISRGKFQLGKMRVYLPEVSNRLKGLYQKVKKGFPFVELCVWDTSWLNEFSQHQTGWFLMILEAEKEVCESLFYRLQEEEKYIFLNPTPTTMERYVAREKHPIIIKPLISQAPLQQITTIQVPTLEKILVDIFSDEFLFSSAQGLEQKYIWENAWSKYTIMEDKLLRYADRRRKKEKVKNWLRQISINRQ